MHFSALFIASAFCFRLASSQALASWYTNLGPQVIYQNASTGDLMYSVDTGSGPGTGGFTSWAKLPLTTPAKAGTSLAGTGFSGGDGNIYVSLQILDNMTVADDCDNRAKYTTSRTRGLSYKQLYNASCQEELAICKAAT